jgi:hypothetical protein
MLVDIRRTTLGRRSVRTKMGPIRLGRALAKVGDPVFVLFGGHVPYVLRIKRRPSSFYEFIK